MRLGPAKNWIYVPILLLLLGDVSFSLYQHYHTPIGGDIAQIVLPSPESGYHKVLQDPLGLGALIDRAYYSNPNRFFIHKPTSLYFMHVPLLLQNLVEPIDSVYLSIALAKTMVQLLIIYLLVIYITGARNPLKPKFLLVALLLAPLFQTSGFNRFMGIVDQSVVYTFFYAVPLSVLLVFLLPFRRDLLVGDGTDFKNWETLSMCGLGAALSLSGPLIPGIILIIALMTFMALLRPSGKPKLLARNLNEINDSLKRKLFVLVFAAVFSIYSLYIGTYNDINFLNPVSLSDRYLALPRGLFKLITTKIGWPLWLFMISLNIFLIARFHDNARGQAILKVTKLLCIFSLLYLVLLPLGGYRIYRPDIIRYDTFMPVTLAAMILYGYSTMYLLDFYLRRKRFVYLAMVITISIIFTMADQLETDGYHCERVALETLAASGKDIVVLSDDCPVMEFRIVRDPLHARLKSELLCHWNVLSKKTLFYQSKLK